MGGSAISAAIREATGVTRARLHALYNELGDPGDVAEACRHTQVGPGVAFRVVRNHRLTLIDSQQRILLWKRGSRVLALRAPIRRAGPVELRYGTRWVSMRTHCLGQGFARGR